MVFFYEGDVFFVSVMFVVGKIIFGLYVVYWMFFEGCVGWVVVVVLMMHICCQWVADVAWYGIVLELNWLNLVGLELCDWYGVAVIYVTVAAGPEVHWCCCVEKLMLLIVDELYYMGDDVIWGVRMIDVFVRVCFWLLLLGTLFCSDNL